MKMASSSLLPLWGMVAVVFLVASCGISPSPRFYTLTSITSPAPVNAEAEPKKNWSLTIGSIEIPDYLDRPEIVTRAKENQLVLSEFDLWGGSLKADIGRVLTENISALLENHGVRVSGDKISRQGTYRFYAVINRFEADTEGRVVLKAQWSLQRINDAVPVFFEDFNVTKPSKGRGYGEVVSAMSEALWELSKNVAGGLESLSSRENK